MFTEPHVMFCFMYKLFNVSVRIMHLSPDTRDVYNLKGKYRNVDRLFLLTLYRRKQWFKF